MVKNFYFSTQINFIIRHKGTKAQRLKAQSENQKNFVPLCLLPLCLIHN